MEWEEQIGGGLAQGKSPSDFDAKSLAEGTMVETEHTDDFFVAVEIAMDHLEEDPNYYAKLATIENPKLKARLLR